MSAGGPQFAKRPTDGRVRRSDLARERLASTVLAEIVERGIFQPKVAQIVEEAAGYKQAIDRLFGGRRLVLTHIARTAPGKVVDAIGLDADTRAKLSEREVRALAWAVLAGRRLERGA